MFISATLYNFIKRKLRGFYLILRLKRFNIFNGKQNITRWTGALDGRVQDLIAGVFPGIDEVKRNNLVCFTPATI
jgi:hypothetical protein